MVDLSLWQSVGPPPPPGGSSPEPCSECGLSRWVELGGGLAEDSYHPNLDSRSGSTVDIMCDFETEPLPFHNDHATRIKAIHVIQHVSRDSAKRLLRESYRVLNSGGTLFLMLTDLDFIITRLVADGYVDAWMNGLYHGPNFDDGFGCHKWAYSFHMIEQELFQAGFSEVWHRGYYNRWDMKVEARKA